MTKEEAIKEAYGIPVNKKQHEALQILIPELKESKSEYERIRKAIVRLIEDLQQSDKNFDGVELTDMLAWLENHNPSFKQISDSIKWDSGLRTGIELGKKEASKAIEYLPKEKIYHIVNELINLSLSGIIPIESEGYTKIVEIKSNVLKLLDYPIEQKPAEWSEEDKKMLIKVEQIVLKHWNSLPDSFYHKYDDEKQDAESCYNWLKSLKDRGNFPKSSTNFPSEWSEEDENTYNRIYCLFRDAIDEWYTAIFSGCYPKITRDKVLAMLKSLRPQSHKETYQAAKHDLAIRFMNYLDENRPEGKMSLSNEECEDIDKAFKENDWAKIMRYAKKYLIQSEQQPAVWSEEDEKMRKNILLLLSCFVGTSECDSNPSLSTSYPAYQKEMDWLKSLPERFNLQPQPKQEQKEPADKGEISDGYHTFNELYYYRLLYNAAFFNLLPKEWVHKSKRHHDGEECFGGGWFIVMANLPTGQISNHYEIKDWDLFHIPEKETADKWDGHTPQEAAERLHKFLLEKPDLMPAEYLPKGKINDIMSKLTNLSYSNLIPINSEEYKKIDEITSDVFDLLDYPIEKKENLKEDRWHKVKESLPDNGRLVLAKDNIGNILLARYDGENWEVEVYDNEDYYCRNFITKWCEIPSEMQNEQKPEAKLTGWVARDSEYNPYSGLGLVLFNEKPRKYYDCWRGAIASQLPWNLFPDLKWEDEPVKVEITIRKK